jgi:hypothetical protein
MFHYRSTNAQLKMRAPNLALAYWLRVRDYATGYRGPVAADAEREAGRCTVTLALLYIPHARCNPYSQWVEATESSAHSEKGHTSTLGQMHAYWDPVRNFPTRVEEVYRQPYNIVTMLTYLNQKAKQHHLWPISDILPLSVYYSPSYQVEQEHLI